MRNPAAASIVFGLVGVLGVAGVALGTVADDLCAPTDDPCVVAGKVTVDPSSILDFGTRTFEIADGGAMTWTTDLTINAGTCLLQRKSKIVEHKDSAGTGFLTLNCGTATLQGKITTRGAGVLVEGNGPYTLSGNIQATGDAVQVIAVDALSPGGITISGKIGAKAKTGTPPGEFRFVSNFGDITVADTAKLLLKGATADPFNDIVWFEADSGALTFNGKLSVSTKTGAYQINLEANQDVLVGPKAKISAKGRDTGTKLGLNSQGGDVTIQGKILAPGKDTGSNGPKVRVCASSDILIDVGGKIIASDGGSSSSIILGAGSTTRVGILGGGATLQAKTDGDIEVCGGTSATIASASVVQPDPDALGTTGACLSPTSQFVFFLDCNQ